MKTIDMDMIVSRSQGAVPVTVLSPQGKLDRNTYLDLIDKAREIYDSGQKFLVLDLSQVSELEISGVFALYSIAMIFQGERPLDPEGGWAAVRSMASHLDSARPFINLYRPQPRVRKALSKGNLPIYDDMATAIASF